ncbi:hypothetical protein B5F90_01420 [Alistipes sp. An31A]|uniref:glycosyltransferase family 4 protein n=1 Tax=Alistipes sp. An31A TaxID=1965631 RepID=UPI000B365AAF|nr:glycosyltransferase family 1 protein [Alistipes sp. An31A]OUO23511.1 hypothetical protein B5F90_01420 [Alistipes sp. An31A]
MKKLLIDINTIIPYYTKHYATGIGRSTLELLKALSKIEAIPFKIILFSQNMRGIKAKKDFSFSCLHFYMPNRPFFKKLSSILRLKRVFCNYDLLHMPNNTDVVENEKKVIYTIHDLAVCRYPQMWGVENNPRFFQQLRASLQNCKAIITCSECSKRDIIAFAHVPQEKVISIPWGINRTVFRPASTPNFVKQLGLPSLYYFSASCNHPRKNLPILLLAFREYLEKGGLGVLVLLNPIETDLIRAADLIETKKIIICRNISDKDLAELYTFAHCSILVSEYEGFGFPILESLACHTMVLSSQNSSLKEVGGAVCDYIKQITPTAICDKLLYYDKMDKKEILNIDELESHLKQFTWDKCASEYVKFYQKQLNI